MSSLLTQQAKGMMQFWDWCRLSAGEDSPTSQPDERLSLDRPSLDILAEVLAVGCCRRGAMVMAKDTQIVSARTTPSAGALYPFEILVCYREGVKASFYIYDADRGAFRDYSSAHTPTWADLDSDFSATGPGTRIGLILLIARPWLSMKKYSRRGYLYTQLDVGHAAANVALSAKALGLTATVHLRFQRQQLAARLSLADLCREIQIGVTIETTGHSTDVASRSQAKPRGAPLSPTGSVNGSAIAIDGLDIPSFEERENWSSLVTDVGSELPTSSMPKVLGEVTSVIEPSLARGDGGIPLSSCPQARTLRRDFQSTVLRRESAKGFLPLPLTSAQVLGIFLDATETVNVDCARPVAIGVGVGVRLLVRRVEGLDVGLYTYSAARKLLFPVHTGGLVAGEEEILLACMGQPVVRHAAAIVALHAPVRHLLTEIGRTALAEVHFHASYVAQKLLLGATRKGAGSTCIGGFDERRCSAVVQLTGNDEVIYLVALGIADSSAVKLDRAQIAYSHRQPIEGAS